MVIRSEYRMEQYRDDEDREDASHFNITFSKISFKVCLKD